MSSVLDSPARVGQDPAMTNHADALRRDLKAARARARRAFSSIPRTGLRGVPSCDSDEYRAWLEAERVCETLRDRIADAVRAAR